MAYLQLCRVSNLPTVWTNVLAGCLLCGAPFDSGTFLLLAGSISCFYLGGMVLNDLCDAGYDALHRPTRPIPSGRVNHLEALMLTVLLFAVGFASLACAPNLSGLYPGALLLVAIVWYDSNHRKNPLSVLLMAGCRFLLFATAAFAVTGRMVEPVAMAGGVQFVYIVALSLVARYENGRSVPFGIPVMPLLLAAISLIDGAVLALLLEPGWVLAGAAGFLLTLAGQRYVRGD